MTDPGEGREGGGWGGGRALSLLLEQTEARSFGEAAPPLSQGLHDGPYPPPPPTTTTPFSESLDPPLNFVNSFYHWRYPELT